MGHLHKTRATSLGLVWWLWWLWLWWLWFLHLPASVLVVRRSAARCGASQLPEPCGRSAVRVSTTNAAAAPVDAQRLLLRRVARWTQPSFATTLAEKKVTNLVEPGGGGADCVLHESV